jgi:hypothetical protein
MKINRWIIVAGMAAALGFGANQALAQNNNNNNGQDNQNQDQGGGRRRGFGGGGGGNFDPAQMRERMMERYKETLEISDDTEWKAIEPLVSKVADARFSSMAGVGRGMFGGQRRGGGGDQGGDQGGGGARRTMFGTPSPEADALQKAIDAKASKAELKTALAKYQEYRKTKQAELEKAQDDLRKVLTARQEAIATMNGLL